MPSMEHAENLTRVMAETQHGSGLLEAMCRAAGPSNWDRPLEALEMYAEARSRLEIELMELIAKLRQEEPPRSWDEIANSLGVTRQTAWSRYRSVDEGVAQLRQRPGPRTESDEVLFTFRSNKSYSDRGEITIPTRFNRTLGTRLRGDGPSWGATLETSNGLHVPIKLRRGHTGGNAYYQLRLAQDAREALRLGQDQAVEVRVVLLGRLVVQIHPISHRAD